jgi:hypothetical protein
MSSFVIRQGENDMKTKGQDSNNVVHAELQKQFHVCCRKVKKKNKAKS